MCYFCSVGWLAWFIVRQVNDDPKVTCFALKGTDADTNDDMEHSSYVDNTNGHENPPSVTFYCLKCTKAAILLCHSEYKNVLTPSFTGIRGKSHLHTCVYIRIITKVILINTQFLYYSQKSWLVFIGPTTHAAAQLCAALHVFLVNIRHVAMSPR